VETKTKYKSRFSRAPVLNEDGSPKAVPPSRLTDQDIEIFKALLAHRFLSPDYIAALIGSSYKYVLTRTQILKSEPNCYLKIADEQLANRRAYTCTTIFLELDSPGITELEELGISVPARRAVKNFTHGVMVDQIMASFRIGARGSAKLISRAHILANPKTPVATRNASVPDRIPLPPKNGKPHYVRPDGEMFVLHDGEHFYFFPGIEADTGSEPIHSYDYERTSIHQKFVDYLTILDQGIYRSHFGANTFFIPFVTSTSRRLASMMTMLEQMTEKHPHLRKSFLFKQHPTFKSSEKPRASGHMVSEPWLRVGYPPMTFGDGKIQ